MLLLSMASVPRDIVQTSYREGLSSQPGLQVGMSTTPAKIQSEVAALPYQPGERLHDPSKIESHPPLGSDMGKVPMQLPAFNGKEAAVCFMTEPVCHYKLIVVPSMACAVDCVALQSKGLHGNALPSAESA